MSQAGTGWRGRWARVLVTALLLGVVALLPGPGVLVEEAAAATPPQLDGGWFHTCAVLASGQVVCWGRNDYGQATPPAGLVASQVSAGGYHTCALRKSDGLVICWGYNSSGQATPPAGLVASQVSAGLVHTCALRKSDGLVVCWGYNADGRATPPAGLQASQVSAGGAHTCASRKSDGLVVCWGYNSNGEATPPAGLQASQVSAGGLFSCASRKSDGVTRCWGSNAYGQAPQPSLAALAPVTGKVGRNVVAPLGDLVGSPLPGSAVYVKTGGSLPAGVGLESYGVIGGRPTAAGNFNVTVTATDGVNFQGIRSYVLTITP